MRDYMNLEEVLKLADDLMFAKTGQHLDDLQKAILHGTLKGKKYTKIAQDSHCHESYVRDVGAKLWQALSEELGEEVKKSNLRSTMERWQVSLFSNIVQNRVQAGSINFCGESRHPPNIPNSNPENQETSNPQQNQTFHHDLSEMPKLGSFYDRTSELQSLKTSILKEKTQLLTIAGIIGIGKTALATKLVQEIKHQFEYVILRSLETSPTVSQLQGNLTEIFTHNANEKYPLSLIKYLQKYRCLIILDDIHHLFSSGELAGQYKSEYEDYRNFFKQIRDLSHQSCFLLVGWSAPREISQINDRNNLNFTVRGLDTTSARQIIEKQGLETEDNCSRLINHYQGNPLWLKRLILSWS